MLHFYVLNKPRKKESTLCMLKLEKKQAFMGTEPKLSEFLSYCEFSILGYYSRVKKSTKIYLIFFAQDHMKHLVYLGYLFKPFLRGNLCNLQVTILNFTFKKKSKRLWYISVFESKTPRTAIKRVPVFYRKENSFLQ